MASEPDVEDMSDKYIVFKTEDWNAVVGHMAPGLEKELIMRRIDPATTFVLRSSDLFGAPALYGYAHLVQTTLELSRLGLANLSDEQYANLERTSDFLAKLADEWQVRQDTKVPD